MRFVVANMFVHAFIKPKRELKPYEVKIKQAIQKIVKELMKKKNCYFSY